MSHGRKCMPLWFQSVSRPSARQTDCRVNDPGVSCLYGLFPRLYKPVSIQDLRIQEFSYETLLKGLFS